MNWLILSPAKTPSKKHALHACSRASGVANVGSIVLLGNAVPAVENLQVVVICAESMALLAGRLTNHVELHHVLPGLLDEREYLPRCISCLLDSFFSLPLEKIRATSPTLECVQTTNQCRDLCQMRRIEFLGTTAMPEFLGALRGVALAFAW